MKNFEDRESGYILIACFEQSAAKIRREVSGEASPLEVDFFRLKYFYSDLYHECQSAREQKKRDKNCLTVPFSSVTKRFLIIVTIWSFSPTWNEGLCAFPCHFRSAYSADSIGSAYSADSIFFKYHIRSGYAPFCFCSFGKMNSVSLSHYLFVLFATYQQIFPEQDPGNDGSKGLWQIELYISQKNCSLIEYPFNTFKIYCGINTIGNLENGLMIHTEQMIFESITTTFGHKPERLRRCSTNYPCFRDRAFHSEVSSSCSETNSLVAVGHCSLSL